MDGDNRGNGNKDSQDGSDSAELQGLAIDKTNTAREATKKGGGGDPERSSK